MEITLDEKINLCRQGDSAGYKMIFEDFARPMLNSSMRIVNNLADAEDMVQEAFCDAFKNIRNLKEGIPFEAWLRRIVINKSISYLRKNKQRIVDIDVLPIADAQEEEQKDEALFAWDVERVKNAISRLPQQYKMVFQMFVIDELPQEEIADALGISHGNVRIIYHRAKAKIISLIKEATPQ